MPPLHIPVNHPTGCTDEQLQQSIDAIYAFIVASGADINQVLRLTPACAVRPERTHAPPRAASAGGGRGGTGRCCYREHPRAGYQPQVLGGVRGGCGSLYRPCWSRARTSHGTPAPLVRGGEATQVPILEKDSRRKQKASAPTFARRSVSRRTSWTRCGRPAQWQRVVATVHQRRENKS